MRDPEADPREYDYDEYWKDPGSFKAKGLKPESWADPWPDLQGMLTADWIRAYHDVVGRMIRPFDPERLRTASYELTLGPRCVVEGEDRLLTPANPRLRIPPNSIAFVSMEQVLLLPHYLVGRFDLAIEFIYQGLLLGTGPQVDPGFQGGLSCPLHNISNGPIEIQLGQPFAKLDFAKTVPRRPEIQAEWSELKTEDELRRWLEDQPAGSWQRLFKNGRPSWRQPIFGYLRGPAPTSSVATLHRRVDQFQRFGFLSLAAILATIVVGIPALIFGVTELATNDLATKAELERVRSESVERSMSLADLERQIQALRERGNRSVAK